MQISSTSRTSRRASRLALAGLALLLAGCDSILDVDRPDIIDPDDLNGPNAIPAFYNGAVGDVAYAQGTFSGLMLVSSLFSDEFRFGGTPPEVREHDLGDVRIQNSFAQTPYLNIHRARRAAARAAERITEILGNSDDARIGELWALSALTIIWVAESYCSGAPFSENQGDDIQYGSPTSTDAALDLALDRLDDAAAATAGDARIINLIAVLRGRALLNKEDFAGAAAAVASVPSSYTYLTTYSSADDRTKNNMKAFEYDFDYLSVSDREGTNGLDYVSANDPRVPTTQLFGPVSRFDGRTPMFQFPKYSTFDAPIVNASGIEARLIEAEAALNAGDVNGWLGKLNEARAQFTTTSSTGTLAPLGDPGSATARVDLMFRERAFHMFATAHRLGDMRRLVRQYGRTVTTVYPTGAYHKDSLTRGNQASLTVPISEENNPNYDESDCDPTQA